MVTAVSAGVRWPLHAGQDSANGRSGLTSAQREQANPIQPVNLK